ncbi:hypothetical protein THAOC_29185, partial [Thalassiosira oceanica]
QKQEQRGPAKDRGRIPKDEEEDTGRTLAQRITDTPPLTRPNNNMDFSFDEFLRGLVRRVEALEGQVESLKRANEALAHETVGMKRENAILRLEVACMKHGGSAFGAAASLLGAPSSKRPRPGTSDGLSISLFSVQPLP